MTEVSRKTKIKNKKDELVYKLNEIGERSKSAGTGSVAGSNATNSTEGTKTIAHQEGFATDEKSEAQDSTYDSLFERWEEEGFEPDDYVVRVPVDSIESAVGYSSLFRQMHQSFVRRVAFYKTPAGGSCSTDEARARAFHACRNKEEAKKEFRMILKLPVENLNFVDLMELHTLAPRVAERFWERVKVEGQKEFIAGHLGANISFPVGYMKGLWNIARYLGVRDSFIEDWKPHGGIEYSLIDMLTQAYFQWQYWLEQTVKRSQTREREEHPEYTRFMAQRQKDFRAAGWTDGFWNRPYVSEQQAVEHAVQMADRWNRIYMRTLRQLRDLRRYVPVTINNANQVNIAADGGQQINVTE